MACLTTVELAVVARISFPPMNSAIRGANPVRFHQLHRWDVSPAEARRIQGQLREQVIQRDDFNEVRRVAGIDVGFEEQGRVARAAVVVLGFPDLTPQDRVITRRPTQFPYIPGLLSFREIPVILDAMGCLHAMPDLLLCDGQGFAHPRRFGLACHLGLLTDLPSIGVAKTRLIGTHLDPGLARGEWVPLIDKEEVIGAVVRTRTRVNPIFVSIGHRVSLETAIRFVLDCTPHYRLPETTRLAHQLASG